MPLMRADFSSSSCITAAMRCAMSRPPLAASSAATDADRASPTRATCCSAPSATSPMATGDLADRAPRLLGGRGELLRRAGDGLRRLLEGRDGGGQALDHGLQRDAQLVVGRRGRGITVRSLREIVSATPAISRRYSTMRMKGDAELVVGRARPRRDRQVVAGDGLLATPAISAHRVGRPSRTNCGAGLGELGLAGDLRRLPVEAGHGGDQASGRVPYLGGVCG